jgi:hypothetical protein
MHYRPITAIGIDDEGNPTFDHSGECISRGS